MNTLTRSLVAGVFVAGAAIGLAGPASAETPNGSYTGTMVDGGGIKGTASSHWNDDTSATPQPPTRHVMQPTTTLIVQPDPNHEHKDVLDQMAGPNLTPD